MDRSEGLLADAGYAYANDGDEDAPSLNGDEMTAAQAPEWPPPTLAPGSDSTILKRVLPSDFSWGLKSTLFFLLALWQVVSWGITLVASKRYFDGCQLAPGSNVSLAGDPRLYLPGQPLPLLFCISCFNGTRVSTFVPPDLVNNFTTAAAQYNPISIYYNPQQECQSDPSFFSCFLFNIYSSTSVLLLCVLLVSIVKYNVQAPATYLLRFGVRVRSSKQQMWAGLGFFAIIVGAVCANTFNQNRESGKASQDTFYTCKDVAGYVQPQGKVVSIQATYLADNPTAPTDSFIDSTDLLRILVAVVQILLLYKDFLLDTLALLTPLAGLDLSFSIDASAPGAAAAIAGVQWRVCPVQLWKHWTLLKLQLHRKGWMSSDGEVACELPAPEPAHFSLLMCLRPCLGVLFHPPLGTREAHALPLPCASGLSLTHFLLLRMQSRGLLEANVADASLETRLWTGLCPCLREGISWGGLCSRGQAAAAQGAAQGVAQRHYHHHDRGRVVPLSGHALALDTWLRSEGSQPFLPAGFWKRK